MSNILPTKNGIKVYRRRGSKTIDSIVEKSACRRRFYYFTFLCPRIASGLSSAAGPSTILSNSPRAWATHRAHPGKPAVHYYDRKLKGFFTAVKV